TLDFSAFTENPTLCALARFIDRSSGRALDEEEPLVAAPRDRPLPLSPLQEYMWRTAQRPATRHLFVMTRCYPIDGPLDVGRLRRSIGVAVARHEILRTCYAVLDGTPVQTVRPPAEPD